MANKLYEETSIQNIANAIRNKNESSDTYTVAEMASAINNLPSQDTGANGLYKAMIEGTAVNVVDDKLTSLISCKYTNVITLTAKQCTEINAFYSNSTITIIKLPKLYQMPTNAFRSCASLTDVIVPLGVGGANWGDTGNQRHFASCPKLKHIVVGRPAGFREFESSFNIETMTLKYPNGIGDLVTTSLHTLVILQNDVTLGSVSYIPTGCPIEQGTGYIYVPESDVESCKQRTNWTVYANQIKGINEQVTISVGDTFTPDYSGSDVATWDIVKLNSWDCATINSNTGVITATNDGYILVRGLDSDGVPIYVAYIEIQEA